MFCPHGFTPLSEVFEKIPNEVVEFGLSLRRDYSLDDNSYRSIDDLFAESPQDVIEERIFRSVGANAYICSPQGVLLRFGLVGLINSLDLWDFNLTDMILASESRPDLSAMPEHFKYIYQLSHYSRKDFLDELDKTPREVGSSQKLAEELSILNFHQRIPMFFERVGYTITLQSYDFMVQYEFQDFSAFTGIAHMLRPFEGWAFCVPADFIDGDLVKSFQNAEVRQSTPDESAQGRPATMRRRTLEAYQGIFPDGHGASSWLEVLRAVNHATGLTASLDTLKRAVRASSFTQKSD